MLLLPKLARLRRFELLTAGLEIRCSIQLSYRRINGLRKYLNLLVTRNCHPALQNTGSVQSPVKTIVSKRRAGQQALSHAGDNLYGSDASGIYYAIFKRNGKQIRRGCRHQRGGVFRQLQ